MCEIPSNELDRWLQIERERFENLVLRLFHTELETVYEEFNMSQDRDSRKVRRAMMESLFPTHPYGTQTTLGKGEHLKNPSMKNIMQYKAKYYVPNNMAICLSGDLDFEKTIQLIDKNFGSLPKKEVEPLNHPKQDPITGVIEKEVYGPDVEYVNMGYRFDGNQSMDKKYVVLIDNILSNSRAGLIDLDLVQKQKVLRAGSYSSFYKDYGTHIMYGTPREGQTLEEVKDLILQEIEKIKKGEFEDWLLDAIIKDFKLRDIRSLERNGRAHKFVDAFAMGTDWADYVKFNDDLEKITKEEIVKFANEHYNNNYVVVYKRNGVDTTVMKVDKPPITPVDINRDIKSDFFTKIEEQKTEKIAPVFLDFKKELTQDKLAEGVDLYFLENKTNDIFTMQYIIEMGGNHNKKLPHAINYLEYLGTDKYTAEELQKEFFKLGVNFGVSAGDDQSYVYISGLEESLEEGAKLLEHLLSNAKVDDEAYKNYVDGVIKKRNDQKLNKNMILHYALSNYAKYGPKNPATDIIPEEDLRALNPEELVGLVHDLTSYEHLVFYYGNQAMDTVKNILSQYHALPENMKPTADPIEYPELDITENKVYWTNYDMVQLNMVMLSKEQAFDQSLIAPSQVFNEYFGGGMGSLVFQEIREAKALAYSAYAAYSVASEPDKANYVFTFIATQPDKLKAAVDGLLGLMNDMPKSEKSFNEAKSNLMKQIETERITKTSIFWNYYVNQKRNIDYDIRKDVYELAKTMTFEELQAFVNEHVKDKKFAYVIIGKKENLDVDLLKTMGTVQELNLEEIFGY